MKALLLFLVLFPLIVQAQAFDDGEDPAWRNIQQLQANKAQRKQAQQQKFQQELFIMSQLSQDSEPDNQPIVIFQPRNIYELRTMQARESWDKSLGNKRPRIIYNMGR